MSEESNVQNETQEEIFEEHEKPVTVKYRDDSGQVRTVTVREFEEGGLAKWMKVMARRIHANSDGKIIKQDYDGFHADLISMCLYDEQGNRMPKVQVEKFGPRLKNHLFELCEKVNGLTKRARDLEGKA